MDEIDLALKKQDHRPAAVTIEWRRDVEIDKRNYKHVGQGQRMPDSTLILQDLYATKVKLMDVANYVIVFLNASGLWMCILTQPCFRIDGTNDEFRGLFRLPTVETRLATARLQYVARVWTVGPDTLRELLWCEDARLSTGWLQSVRLDLVSGIRM